MIFECPIIGDGASPETAYRPDLSEVLLDGHAPSAVRFSIAVGEDGKPLSETVVVEADFG